jgi:hypothetical protein
MLITLSMTRIGGNHQDRQHRSNNVEPWRTALHAEVKQWITPWRNALNGGQPGMNFLAYSRLWGHKKKKKEKIILVF